MSSAKSSTSQTSVNKATLHASADFYLHLLTMKFTYKRDSTHTRTNPSRVLQTSMQTDCLGWYWVSFVFLSLLVFSNCLRYYSQKHLCKRRPSIMQGMRRDAGREEECTGGGGKGKDNHTASHHTISPYNKTIRYCNNTATTLQQHFNNTASHHTIPRYNKTTTYCNNTTTTLQHTCCLPSTTGISDQDVHSTQCNTPQHNATTLQQYCSTPLVSHSIQASEVETHTATTLQHTATTLQQHCSTLQHTATTLQPHCNHTATTLQQYCNIPVVSHSIQASVIKTHTATQYNTLQQHCNNTATYLLSHTK